MLIRVLFRGVAVAVLASAASPARPESPEVDAATLTGKVMCGYQGWFNAEGDGANRGYTHWTRRGARPAPDTVRVDLWPDVSELGRDERFPTDLLHADGRRAEVFSSHRRATVVRHFRWMEEHGIDGVFLQRFVRPLARRDGRAHANAVLEHCRAGAREHGRVYAMMYDLSGLEPGQADRLIEDWKTLLRDTRLLEDPRYLRHRGKPLLALWGCGFKDDKKPRPSLDDWRTILRFLKDDPEGGDVAIMLGVPSFWRERNRDCIPDDTLPAVLQMADVISPWTPGRYRTPEAAARHAADVWRPDLAWCRDHGLDYLPVTFPGFSWHNMQGAPLDDIPRRGGRFFWSQVVAAKRAGAEMLYVAMFDEVDEGTAIFKCTNDPPTANGAKFVTYEGLPSDHYLRLTGLAGRVIRGALPPDDAPPPAEKPSSPSLPPSKPPGP